MLIDLKIKAAILGVFIILTAYGFHTENMGLAMFSLVLAGIMFLFVNMELQTKNAAVRIRRMIGSMGYSPAETEELTWRVISILKEEDAKISVKYSKDWQFWASEFASSLTRWSNFTQSDVASALQTALTLAGKNK
jgi:hypothetical protein